MNTQELQAAFQNQINSAGQVVVDDATLATTGVGELLQEAVGDPSVTVTQPTVSDPGSDTLVLGGVVSLFGIDGIAVTLTFTDDDDDLTFVLEATFPVSSSFTLSSLASQVFGQGFTVPQNFAGFGFSSLTFELDTAARTLKLAGQSNAPLDVLGTGKFLVGPVVLGVSATYPAAQKNDEKAGAKGGEGDAEKGGEGDGETTTVSASLAGPLTVAGATFDVTGDVGQGMTFDAKLAEGQSVSLLGLARALVAPTIALPFDDILLDDLSAAFDTSDSTYSFETAADFTWAVPVGDSSITTQVKLSVEGSGTDGATGTLAGTWTVGPSVFDLSYTLGPGSNLLEGSWAANGKSLGYLSLAAALGIPTNGVQLPSALPDLGLKSAALTIDFQKKKLVLMGDSTTYGQGFFVASNDDGWGFALGLALPSPWTFGSLPAPLNSALSPLDFLTFEDAFFIVSSMTDDSFSFDEFAPLSEGGVSIVPGLTFGSKVDLTGSAQGTIANNLQTVLGQDTLTVLAVISTDATKTQLSVALSGQPIPVRPFTNLTLENPQLVIAASPLAVTFEGTFSLPLDGKPLDVETALSVGAKGATFSADATTPGGITAPFGFNGVTLEQVGLVGGLQFTPPGVSMGLNGIFRVGSSPADSFALVLVLEGELINPVLLYGKFGNIALAPVFDAVFQGQLTLPPELQQLGLKDLYLCWAEPGQTYKLPDGTTPPPGFGMNGTLDVTSDFTAQAALTINMSTDEPGIAGSASMSAVNVGNGALVVTGKSALGGPLLAVSTSDEPYLNATLDVSMLKLASADVQATVGDGFSFALGFNVAGRAQTFNCDLVGYESFRASAALDFPLRASFGPVVAKDINLGTVNVNEEFKGNASVSIGGSGVAGSIGGSFGRWSMPTLTLNASVTDLSNILGMVVAKISAEAQTVFSALFADAGTWLRAVQSGLITVAGGIAAIGKVLVNFFGETVPQAATLVYNNYSKDLGQLVQLLYGLGASANDAYNILVGLGFSAADVGSAVVGVFHQHVDTQPFGHVDTGGQHGDTKGPHGDTSTPHADRTIFGKHGDVGGHIDTSPHVDATAPHIDTGHIDIST